MQAELSELLGRDVSRETCDKMRIYRNLLTKENDRQNLVSASTLEQFDTRHLIDSAQLLTHAPQHTMWLDVGSGAGLPGIVLAILNPSPITLVEPRRLRADFLSTVIETLDLGNATIRQKKVEQVTDAASVITGRAVANIAKFLALTEHLADLSTTFVLPKGRKAAQELEDARKTWQGRFRLVASVTDPEASILVASEVRRRGRR